MKLILTQEVTGLGGPGDIVEVKDGYGRNYLVPRGLAIAGPAAREKQIAPIRRGREVREIRDLGQAQEVAGQLGGADGRRCRLAPAQGGRLFGSVTAADVAAAVKAAGGPSSTAPHRAAAANQDRRHAHRLGAAAPRGRRDRRGRGHSRELSTTGDLSAPA